MLHRFIAKELSSSKKKRATIHPNISKDEPSSELLLSSPKLKESMYNTSGFFQRRNSKRTNSVDFTINPIMINPNPLENFTTIIDNKNKKIWELEEKIENFSQHLVDLYIKMKEFLIIDEVFNVFFLVFSLFLVFFVFFCFLSFFHFFHFFSFFIFFTFFHFFNFFHFFRFFLFFNFFDLIIFSIFSFFLFFSFFRKIRRFFIKNYDKELKKIFFNEELLKKIKENDPKITIDLLQKVMERTLNLRRMIQVNYKKALVIDDKEFDIEKDYLVLVHRYENEIRDMKNVKKRKKPKISKIFKKERITADFPLRIFEKCDKLLLNPERFPPIFNEIASFLLQAGLHKTDGDSKGKRP